jgi:hypothetical protein
MRLFASGSIKHHLNKKVASKDATQKKGGIETKLFLMLFYHRCSSTSMTYSVIFFQYHIGIETIFVSMSKVTTLSPSTIGFGKGLIASTL